MIRVDAIEQVSIRDKYLLREEELNSAAIEGDRFLHLLPLIPKNVSFREVETFLRQHDFFFMPILDDDKGQWTGYRNIVEVYSANVPADVPGIYIVALITTIATEIPSQFWNGDKLYKRR